MIEPTRCMHQYSLFRFHPLLRFAAILGLTAAMVVASQIAPVRANTSLVCKLVGKDTHNGTDATSNHQPNLKLFGTDLGFSFRFRRNVIMLFGDTWNEANAICLPPKLSDDALGWINYSKDNNPDDCLDINFPTDRKGDLKPLRVFKDGVEQNMGAFQTPITGWADRRRPYGYFTGEGYALCNPNASPACPDGLQCQNGVFCVDPGSSPTGLPDSQRAVYRHIATSSTVPETPDFTVGYTFATSKFMNATAKAVRRFSEENPKSNNYDTTAKPREMLMWGRPSFATLPGFSSDVYLLHHPLAALYGPGTTIDWKPRYFAGLDNNGNPVWTNDQIFAIPVIQNEPKLQVLQFSIAWVKPIKRFVMLYSGRLPHFPADGASGIYMRTAKHPWGKWSDPKLVWNPLAQGAYNCPGLMYIDTAAGFDCPKSDPFRPNFLGFNNLNQCPAQTPVPNSDHGVEYGVNILEEYTKPGLQLNSATIYWNMSIWNPYRVVLMKTTISQSILTD